MTIYNQLLAKVGIPLVEKCSNTRFWSLYNKMQKLHVSNDEVRARHQEDKIESLLDQAYSSIPYWQQTIEADHKLLSAIALSGKQTYTQRFPDDITAKETIGDWQYLTSAGTTDRMTVVVNFIKRDYLRAAEHLNLMLATGTPIGSKAIDIPPSACNVVCGFADEGPEPLNHYLWWALRKRKLFDSDVASGIRGRVERQILLKRQVLLPIDSAPWEKMIPQLDRYLDKIIDQKVQIIRALPHFLLWLATRAQQRQLLFPNVITLLPYGGLASHQLIRRIEAAFGARFVNVYGTGEVGSIGCASQDPNIVEVYSDMVCLEVLNEKNEPVKIGETGKVVVTDLNNYAMPIIRYAIGDVAEVVEYNKNNGYPKTIKVCGRQQECISLGDTQPVTPQMVQDLFFQHEQIINFKIELLSNTIVKVSYVSLTPINETEILEELKQLLPQVKKVMISQAEFLLPEASGKFLSVKQKKGTYHV